MCKRKKMGVHGTLEIHFRQSFTKETYFYDEQLKSYEKKY